jgi:tripartite-type tricarboxylate transporter receptor subunit TctC
MAGIKMIHVAYKGGGPVMIALLTGEVSLSFNGTSVFPHLQSKKLIPLGVTGLKRLSAAPDVPTISESGVPGYEVIGWNAIFAPAGTPTAVIDKLNQLIRRWLNSSETKIALEAQGLEPNPGTPQELEIWVKSEIVKWAKLIKEVGIKPE